MLRQLRNDDGSSLAELAVASMLGAILLTALVTFLMNTMNTGAFTEGQSATLNDVRNAMQKIEKEVRGADSITWCAPLGSCIEVGAQTPTGNFLAIRYTHAGTELQRSEYNSGSSTWGDPLTLIERLANTSSQKVFACDTQSTLLRLTVDLHVEPTPVSDPNLNVQTSIRPRNFPSVASCP